MVFLRSSQREEFVNISNDVIPKATTATYPERVSNASSELEDDYKMAVEVAVGSAIIVALAMLVALIWKTLKRNAGNGHSGVRSSVPNSRRLSTNSLERLVDHRLQDCPPPYSPDADKPPSYEESFDDRAAPEFGFSDDRGFEDSFVRLSQSPRPPTQVNSSSYDNEILDGGDQSGRPSLAITRISNISSTVDACQATQTINDQDNNVLFALHL